MGKPNMGNTILLTSESIGCKGETGRTEPSQYPEEKKENSIP